MKMCVSLSLLFSLFLLIHTTNGFDITQILNQHPDFSTFNNYLTQTNLAVAINARQTITVLVVDNANLAPLSSKSPDVIKNILSVHVVLDYYDVTKLQQLSTSSALLTTLFQASGLAKGQQGFLNVTYSTSTNVITFGSAMPGSTQGSSLVKPVASEPYNISIIQVSNAIIPQGIDGTKTSSPPTTSPSTSTPPPPPPPPPATASAPPKSSMAPPPSTVPPTPSQAKAPTSSPPTKAQAPTTAQAPTSADTPSAAPGSAPPPGTLEKDAPSILDSPADDKPKAKSAATAGEIGLAIVCTMALSTLYLGSRI